MKRVLVFSFITLSAALLFSCASKEQKVEQVVLPKVKVQGVRMDNVQQQVVYTANLEAYVKNNIAPQQPRRIKKLYVEVGDHVRQGQLLVQLDDSFLTQAAAQLDNSRKEWERARDLYEVGGTSRSELDSRTMSYEVAKSSYENMVENTRLVAPCAGVISARNYDNGDMIGQSPVYVLDQIDRVKIRFSASEQYTSVFRKGMKIPFTLDAFPGEQFTGVVSRFNPTVDPATHSFQVELTYANPREKVRPGMFARVIVPLGKKRNIICPDRAVQKLMGSGDRFVYVLEEDGTVRYSKVTLGRRMDDTYEILDGLADGDIVVIEGQAALKSGCKVEVVNE